VTCPYVNVVVIVIIIIINRKEEEITIKSIYNKQGYLLNILFNDVWLEIVTYSK
jgi:hypothetical protein